MLISLSSYSFMYPTPHERQAREPSGAPEGKWGHSGFIQQNNIKGGGLAARMAATRPPGGIENPEEPKRSRRPARVGGGGESMLVDRAMAAATGAGAGATKGRGAGISVKGASGATVEVRNLAKGTSADDVQVSRFCRRDRTDTILLSKT